MKLITSLSAWGNEVLIPLKISGIGIIYPTGLDKEKKPNKRQC
jgi:hypothetical protein